MSLLDSLKRHTVVVADTARDRRRRTGAAGGHGHVREGATRMRHEMPGPFSGIQFGLADEVGDHLAEAENRP